jgi:hypothetical protein
MMILLVGEEVRNLYELLVSVIFDPTESQGMEACGIRKTDFSLQCSYVAAIFQLLP